MSPPPSFQTTWSDLFLAWNEVGQEPANETAWAVFMLQCDRLETMARKHAQQAVITALQPLNTALEALGQPGIDECGRIGELLPQLAETLRGLTDRACTARRVPALRSPEPHPRVLVCGCAADADAVREARLRIGQYGYRMEVAATGSELIRLTDTSQPLLALVDISRGFDDAAHKVIDELTRRGIAWCALAADGAYESRLKAVREGARYFFVSPLDVDELVRVLDPLAFPIQEEPYRVLMLDDSRTALESVRLALRSHDNIQLGVLIHASKILETLHHLAPDVLLLDFRLEGCTGVEVARIIRQHRAFESIPIIYLTGESGIATQRDAMRHGGDDFLVKPVADDLLVHTLINKAERYRGLRRLMEEDGLTGLYNHAKTKMLVAHLMAQASRNAQPMSYALLDIDHFKRVNDTHGHGVGDQVIKALARHLRQHLRAADVVGRYGGEEFAVVFPNCDGGQALVLIDTIRESFSALDHGLDGAPLHCTFSAGVAQYPGSAISANELMGAADKALYAAKGAGRNRTAQVSSAH